MFFCEEGATILGGGDADGKTVAKALKFAPFLICADGGADTAARLGHNPRAIIGDLDSLSADVMSKADPGSIFKIHDQNSTDFDKCVSSVSAPFFIALGVLSPRFDHALAALNVLLRHKDKKILLITPTDICMLAPPEIHLQLPMATRVSLFPMARTEGCSTGLKWNIDGLKFCPASQTGTSNETTEGIVYLKFVSPAMIAIVPSECIASVLPAYLEAAKWKAEIVNQP